MKRSKLKKSKKFKKRKKYFLISLTIILLLFTFNITVSRYLGELKSNQDVVAVPILSLDNDGLCYEIDDMLPGDKREIEFNVSNEDKDKKNEVLLDYYFIVNLESEIPLKVEIYDVSDGKEKKLSMDDNGKTQTEQLNYIKNKTEEATIKNYVLKIIWNKEDNDYNFAKEPIVINVNLKGTQAIN